MTSVSSLGSALTQYKSPISSLDTNGDGIVSADELAAAGQTSASTTSTSSTNGDTTASASDLISKVKSDILALMLSLQQQSAGDDSQSADGSSDDSKGIFAAMDTNGDGKLTEAEFLAADPQKTAAADSSDSSDPAVTGILADMQAAMLAYNNTYGASAAAVTATDDVQPA